MKLFRIKYGNYFVPVLNLNEFYSRWWAVVSPTQNDVVLQLKTDDLFADKIGCFLQNCTIYKRGINNTKVFSAKKLLIGEKIIYSFEHILIPIDELEIKGELEMKQIVV